MRSVVNQFFLFHRKQNVSFNHCSFFQADIKVGAPQDSSLDPLLFLTLYK